MRVKEVKSFEKLKKNHVYKRMIAFIKHSAVFIYPTDTIYGIGCNAMNEKAVKRIRAIKKRDKKPFSIIAPSKKWIKDNCVINKKYLDKLPGKYTIICKTKKKCVSKSVSPNKTLGVRIPKHWISKIAKELKIPIVTTSVNISGQKNMNSVKEFEKLNADFCLWEGEKKSNSSTIIDLTSHEVKVIKR
jgi:tRNA threonylcarbamoyl adenosine modification protein (Sua5/YciO/YrdC/YwlC family)